MYAPLLACLSLATLLAVDALVSLGVAGLWPAVARAVARLRSARRARLLFLLRTAPALTALAAVFALLVPSYLMHEPRDTREAVGLEIGFAAALALAGIARAARHGTTAWLATRRLIRVWEKDAAWVSFANAGVRARLIRHRFPVIGVVGIFRSRLFISEQVLSSLSAEELAAALAHERGHLAAGDNLKLAVLRACRDVLCALPVGRDLERRWHAAAEEAADEYAAQQGPAAALDLASALVKVARLVPPGATPALPAGAAMMAGDPGSLGARVTRLIRRGHQPAAARRLRARAGRAALPAALALLAAALLTACGAELFVAVHRASEFLVAL